ncbi:head GIN domain-containing protein [Polaribacter sp. PL03]|uniref:head GIN domain-containing protein n=1 Tax=Polaribacter sp. PL03 TaxID=3088353 RepID=UPI0029D15E05|nr:head GIN domain-containing protein [Polaribacter sp. PL03]MDX6746858.1 head GIN domain-containing protein [Polaribacter sp. PL03]
MKKSINQLFIVLFVTTLFSSCNADIFNKVIGNKNVTVKQRKLEGSFTGIKVSSGIDLYISQGDTKISVEADENLHDLIITKVNEGVLNIYVEKNIWRSKAKKVYVTLENLTLLKATSGSDVYSETVIRTKEISISATSGADINFKVDAESVATSATSGSDINISGVTINHASNATSGSSIDAYNLKSENVIVKATSGADINIYASEKMEANATSGGDIDFKGNPTIVNKKSTSGGSISRG